MFQRILLVLTPTALVLDRVDADPTLIFAITAFAMVPLIGIMAKATEHLADAIGPTAGGLLNASLGSFPDLIIGLFAMQKGLQEVVKASISGAILANILFTLGLSIFLGGLRHPSLKFNPRMAGLNAGMLQLAAVALLIPAIFHMSAETATRDLSLEIAVLLFLVYLASLVFTFTHPSLITARPERPAPPPGHTTAVPARRLLKRNILLVVLTGTLVAILSETLTDSIEPMTANLGLTPLFSGIVLLALLGSASELSSAIRFARRNQPDLVLGIAVGSSLQIALFVAPVLVFASYVVGEKPLDLLFSHFEIAAIVLGTFIALRVLANGETSWIEGLMAMVVYLMLGYAFFMLPA